MPAADWTFLPLGPGTATDGAVAALARPDDGRLRTQDELAHLVEAARLIGQARDREELEGERRAREGLVETDRLRQTLLAALAHDFRTPLTVLIGRLAGLAATSPDAAEALGAARRLDRMMADLLGAARLEAGALEPRIERIDLVDAVAGAIEATRSADSPVIRNSLAPDLPLVPADPLLLHHLLVNLLDNAQRHARTRVQVEARATDGRVILAVADDGLGIPLADRDRLFDRFTRLEGSDRTGGSGLGLAIVKGFAEAMDMQVTLTEAEGGGARFELAFP
jgi:two-component system sensor histidine kinase KdpD